MNLKTALAVLLLLLTACAKPQIHERQFLVFGTIITVTIVGSNDETTALAFATLTDDFNYLHEDWHAWKEGSLGRVNHLLPFGKPFTTGPELIALISKAKKISRDSNYLFNPALGKLIALWGFHQDEPGKQQSDIANQVKKLIDSNPTLDDIKIDGVVLSCSNPDVQLDFGGFAKGYALNLAAQQLLDLKLNNFIINAGGDLVAYGTHLKRPWRIGIRDPRGNQVLAAIEPKNGEGIFTSGDYERFYLDEGKRRHHIIDPRTGEPSQGAQAVTVIHKDAALADAAATALMIANDDEWEKIAQQMGISHVLRINHSGSLQWTEPMHKRIKLEARQ